MAGNSNVAKQCKEWKNELRDGNKETLVDALLRWVGRGKPVSSLVGIIVFFVLPYLIGLLIAVVLGELDRWQRLFGNMFSSPVLLAWSTFGLFTSTVSMFIANSYFRRIVVVIRDYLLDIVESQKTLEVIKYWINFLYNKKAALLTGILGGALVTPLTVLINRQAAGVFVGIGHTITLFLFSFQSTLFFGFLLGILAFAYHVQNFELRLFEADPSNSEVVDRLSVSLNWFVYLVAVYGAVQTFAVVTLQLPYFTSIMFIFWGAIVGIFLLSQYGLAQIIRRAKWKTLNKIQKNITAIQNKSSALSKDEKENLNWLLEYHDRVKMTRNTAFDWSAGLSFLNSMLLPLIGFMLGNLDTIIAFFR